MLQFNSRINDRIRDFYSNGRYGKPLMDMVLSKMDVFSEEAKRVVREEE